LLKWTNLTQRPKPHDAEKGANTEDLNGRSPSKKEYLKQEVNDHEPSYFHIFFVDQTFHYSNHYRVLVFCSTTLKISGHLIWRWRSDAVELLYFFEKVKKIM
jgi:hypothetical protein